MRNYQWDLGGLYKARETLIFQKCILTSLLALEFATGTTASVVGKPTVEFFKLVLRQM